MLVCFSVPLGISVCIYVIGCFKHSCRGLFILVWEGGCLSISPLPPAPATSLFLVSSTCFCLSLRVPLQEHIMAREHSQTDGSMWWCHIFEWECSSHLPLSPSDQTGTNSIKWEKRRWGLGGAGGHVNLFCLLGIPYPLWSHCHHPLRAWSARHPSPSTSWLMDDFIQAKGCGLEICCWKVWACAWFECLMAVWPWQVSGSHCLFPSAKWNWYGSNHFHSGPADSPRAEQKSFLSRGNNPMDEAHVPHLDTDYTALLHQRNSTPSLIHEHSE